MILVPMIRVADKREEPNHLQLNTVIYLVIHLYKSFVFIYLGRGVSHSNNNRTKVYNKISQSIEKKPKPLQFCIS